MTGPLPPAIGGMVTVINDLKNSTLSQKVQLNFFNTGKTTKENRNILIAIITKFNLWFNWIKLLSIKQKTIVHIHTCSGLSFFFDGVLICLSRMLSVPVVLHIHGGKFDDFILRLNKILFFVVYKLFKSCSRIIVLSDSWKNQFLKLFPDVEYCVVENGVPIPKFNKKRVYKKEKVEILFLGNLTILKGVLDLITAMKGIKGARLNFVGGEEEKGIITEMKALILKLGLSNQIKIHGPMFGEDKNRVLQTADIFILPSYAEGLPISLLEAMAEGLPVIVSSVGGIPSVVTNYQEGLLINPGDTEQINEALRVLVNDSDFRKRMGNNARNRCVDSYGIENTVDKLMTIYSELFA